MKNRLLFLAALAASLTAAHAQVSYTGTPYTQNFNTLAGTTNNTTGVTWTDNSTLPGWYAALTTGAVPTYGVTNGTMGGAVAAFDDTDSSPTTNINNVGLFSFGTASSTDRALGSRATSNWTGHGTVAFGVRLVNNTAQTITAFNVSFTGEQWHKNGGPTAHTLPLQYQVGASSITAGTWTSVATFSSPVNTGTIATLDGNASANRRGVAGRITGISWAPGAELWLRIADGNESGSEQALGIDDLVFSTEDGSGLYFNGATNHVTAGAATSTLGASVLTLEAWIYRTGNGTTTSTGTGGVTAYPIVTKGRGESESSGLNCNYFLGLDASNRLVADFEAAAASGITTGQNYPVTGTSTIPFNQWTHVAATYDGAASDGEKWKLYVNGSKDTTAATLGVNPPTNAAPEAISTQHFAIGTAMNSTGVREGTYLGIIDEVRVWNFARTPAEIAAGMSQEITSGTGLLGRFGFAEGTGATAANSANASVNGTLVASPVWLNGRNFTPNTPPTVTLDAPANGGTAEAPATINLAATASDTDGTITKVEFFNGATLLGEDTTAPYTLTVTNAPQGSYSFTAKATDNLGGIATSSAASFTVTPSNNPPPTIAAASPANNATGQPLIVPLQVSVGDPGNEALNVKYFGRRAAPAPGPDFTLVTLPDTQFYSENLNNRFPQFLSQTNWIVSSKATLNTAFVAHMGDMVQSGDNGGNNAEWLRADQAMDLIEQHASTLTAHGIPWGGAPGNHDFGTGGGSGTTTFWNQFFGTARWAGRPYFRGNYSTNNNNNYQFFSASGLDFIVINLAYNPNTAGDQAVLDWADALLKANPNRRAIITSHWIVNIGNPATFGGHGQAIYDNLKDNPNLFLLLCGHVHGEGQRTDVFQGRSVHSVLQDYQDRSGGPGGQGGGDGWLRYFIFSPANGTISARTYRTTSGAFETDADSQFTLNYHMQTPLTDWVQLDEQNLAGGTTSTIFNWPGLEAGKDYEWYAVVSDGVTQVSTSARRFTTAANAAPTIALDTPVNNASFTAPATINLTATANDADGSIARVEFFQGNTKLGEDTSAPYELAWTGVGTGSYALSAVAVDNSDATALSNIVNVSVTNPNNVLPTVEITAPVEGASFTAPANITINANAADTDGTVTKVEFYQGATLLGEDASAPYSFAWNGVALGSYALTAKAYDNDGGIVTSSVVNVAVALPTGFQFSTSYAQNFNGMGTAGTVPPQHWSVKNDSGGSNTTWASSITLGTMVNAAGALTATPTPSGTNNNGFNAAASAGDTTDRVLASSPTGNAGTAFDLLLTNNSGGPLDSLRIAYAIRRYTSASTAGELPGYWLFYSLDNGTTWVNVAALNPTLSGPGGVIVPNTTGTTNVPPTVFTLANAWANGANLLLRWVDDNATQSSPDQITGLDNLTINIGQPPLVALSAPANGATYVAPATVSLAATASDPDGTIAKVEFFAGATLLGEDTSAPFTFAWTGVTAGSYALTAVATDNQLNTTTSAPLNIIVLADTDLDGLPDVWETANGLNPNLAGDATLDRDGDGLNNAGEFYAGTDPQNPADKLDSTIAQEAGGSFKIRIRTVAGRTYRVEWRANLITGNWQSLAENIAGTGAEVEVTDPITGESSRFYRIIVQP